MVILSRSFLERNAALGLAVALTGAAVYFFSGSFTTVRFDRERIEVEVEHSTIRVVGHYRYVNESALPAVLRLRVPFPIDPEHPQPTAVILSEAAEDGRMLRIVSPSVRGEDVTCRLVFMPGEAKWLRLSYLQSTRVSAGRYILTTTRAWRYPMKQADYTLNLPPGFSLVSSSYALTTLTADRWKTYGFSRADFYPEHDWEFAWEEPRLRAARGDRGRR